MASDSNPKQKTSLRGVTNEVTKEKLSWLDNQHKALKAHYLTILEKYENPENKVSLKFLKEVHDALNECPDDEKPVKNIKDLSVLLNWINTVDEDDGVIYFGSKELVKDWIERMVKHIRNKIEKCEYSCMYGNTMTQYMEGESAKMSENEDDGESARDGNAQPGDGKKETIAEFEKRSFSSSNPEDFNKNDFEELLKNKLFNMEDESEKKQLLDFQHDMSVYCKDFADKNPMSIKQLKISIGGLLNENLLDQEKTATLKELRENKAALTEVSTLLNKRIKNYGSWSWPGPVVVNFKRTLAGRYRAYMDEDILTAIFLHFIGAKWSVYFKRYLKSIYNSKMWKWGTGTVADLYYESKSIEGYRRKFHEKTFLSVLPDKMEDQVKIYDDENDNSDSDEENTSSSKRKTDQAPVEIKQQLLHIISNEIHLNNILRPEKPLTIVQTDMEWFGPSLIHEVVLSVMKFFGLTKEWLTFFRNFLEAPLQIGSPSAPVHIRKRGAPICHNLSTVFGESLLFVMDLYVNRESGLSIHRIHDDFWFWSHHTENVIKAWTAMQTFTKLAGLKLNEEKSASIVCKSDLNNNATSIIFGQEPLPQRNVKWGFIVLYSDGIFRISNELLAPHVKQMREYLEKSDSVMNWIHGHNKFIRFFIRNFGEPALTFKKQHVVQIMKMIKAILKQVHPTTNGSAVEALKLKFSDIFKGTEVMDAWIYFPIKSGGLSLYNPFLDLIPLHEAYRRSEEEDEKNGNTSSRFSAVLNSDKIEWDKLLEKSKERQKKRHQHSSDSKMELQEDTISDEESEENSRKNKCENRINFETRCRRYRETKWNKWQTHYCRLLQNLDPIESSQNNWKKSLYIDQVKNKLGHEVTEFVDENLVPLSLISAIQSEPVHKN